MHAPRAVIAVLLGLCTSLFAQDWPRFRGPNGTGLGTANLPEQIAEGNILWHADLPGTGHSSPVTWGDRIFITCTPAAGSLDEQAKRSVVCVGAKDGSLVWKKEFATAGYHLHSDNSFASPSCATDSERVFAWMPGPDTSFLVALSQSDGKELWKRELGPFHSQHGPGASPIVENGIVYLQSSQDEPGSFLQAFEASTGKPLWKRDLKGGQHAISTPCLFPSQGGTQLLSLSTDNGLLALNPSSGDLLWSLPDLFTLRCVASPVITPSGLIVVQCGQGQAQSEIQVIKGAAERKPAKLYDIVRTGGYVPTPIVVDDLLFLWKENGTITCVRSADNEQLWSERVPGPYYASPICVGGKGGHLYNITRNGEIVVVAATDKFHLIQRFPLGEKNTYASLAASGGKLLARAGAKLFCIGVK